VVRGVAYRPRQRVLLAARLECRLAALSRPRNGDELRSLSLSLSLGRAQSAFGPRSSWHCWLNTVQDLKILRRGFAFFSCYANWLVTLLSSALYC